MFTGIVQGLLPIVQVQKKMGLTRLSVNLGQDLAEGLKIGASVALNGVCLTAAQIEGTVVSFDVIQETLNRTSLRLLEIGHQVNGERAAKFGDEIGGHWVSGHVYGMAEVFDIERDQHRCVLTLKCDPDWSRYLFSKGYIALDGASLTLVDVKSTGLFTVHLIPETLRLTTFGFKQKGDAVNVELDSQTQAIVETVERFLARNQL